jgi:hypothetical protein
MTTDDFDFASWLQEFGHGATNKQATGLLQKLISACQETGKAGSIVLTIKVGAVGALAELKASIKTTVPQPELPGGSYYVTEAGALVTEDPRQTSMPRVVLEPVPFRNRDNKGD